MMAERASYITPYRCGKCDAFLVGSAFKPPAENTCDDCLDAQDRGAVIIHEGSVLDELGLAPKVYYVETDDASPDEDWEDDDDTYDDDDDDDYDDDYEDEE